MIENNAVNTAISEIESFKIFLDRKEDVSLKLKLNLLLLDLLDVWYLKKLT
jgi:hypothetical protein